MEAHRTGQRKHFEDAMQAEIRAQVLPSSLLVMLWGCQDWHCSRSDISVNNYCYKTHDIPTEYSRKPFIFCPTTPACDTCHTTQVHHALHSLEILDLLCDVRSLYHTTWHSAWLGTFQRECACTNCLVQL